MRAGWTKTCRSGAPGVFGPLGRQAEYDVQPGVAGPRNHNPLVLSCSAHGASFISGRCPNDGGSAGHLEHQVAL
jgi:hypothetical protein